MNLRNDVRTLLPIVRIKECDCPEPAAPSVVEFHHGCAHRLRGNRHISQIHQRGSAPWSHEEVHDNAHGGCRIALPSGRRVGLRGKFINWGTNIVAAFVHIERALGKIFGRPRNPAPIWDGARPSPLASGCSLSPGTMQLVRWRGSCRFYKRSRAPEPGLASRDDLWGISCHVRIWARSFRSAGFSRGALVIVDGAAGSAPASLLCTVRSPASLDNLPLVLLVGD